MSQPVEPGFTALENGTYYLRVGRRDPFLREKFGYSRNQLRELRQTIIVVCDAQPKPTPEIAVLVSDRTRKLWEAAARRDGSNLLEQGHRYLMREGFVR